MGTYCKTNIVLHIPAREGSKRVPRKNVRNMAGQPMIFYTIQASLDSQVTKNIYVNTDADEIKDLVQDTFPNISIYHRSKDLASDYASSDQFNMDIINALEPDILIMVNPVCPLIDQSDIKNALQEYLDSDCDTLISCSTTQMQTFCEDIPVNINLDEELAPSQNNPVVQTLNWAITIWDAKSFKRRYNSLGYAALGVKRILYPIDHLKSFKVSEERDFAMCEALLKSYSR